MKAIIFLLVLVSSISFAEHGTGLIIPKNWKTFAGYATVTPETFAVSNLPRKYDWREQVEQAPSIVNQGRCGSCWAFGTTAVLRWQLAINQGITDTLSEQEILSCSRRGSCGGGYFAHAYQETSGQSEGNEFPYTASNQRCKTGLSHKYRIKTWGYIGGENRSPSVEEIKYYVYHIGPVGVTITSNGAMQNYRGGIFNSCSRGQTNHIVHIVGWDDEQGVWIMGNSWGAGWGEKGYMRIKYGCSRIGEIATYVVY